MKLLLSVQLGKAIAFVPFQPGFLNLADVAVVSRIHRVGASDVAEREEPVPALRLHPFRNQGYHWLAHGDDFLVGGVLGYLLCVRHQYGFVLPLVSQFSEAFGVWRFCLVGVLSVAEAAHVWLLV